MQLDQATANIRLRTPWEAIDLGFKLLVQNYATVMLAMLVVSLPLVIVLNLLIPEYAAIIFWWCKPLLSVVPLFVVSRALFGSQPSVGMTLKQWPRMVWRRLLWTLSVGRLDPGRSFNLPISQLEGLSGSARRQRGRVLRAQDFSAAFVLTLAFLLIELCVVLGLYAAFLVFVAPIGIDSIMVRIFLSGESYMLAELFESAWYSSGGIWGLNVFWYVAIMLLEPFFVAGGFCLYLNRRSWLEGWDIEIAFRKLRQRLLERQKWQASSDEVDVPAATQDDTTVESESPNAPQTSVPATDTERTAQKLLSAIVVVCVLVGMGYVSVTPAVAQHHEQDFAAPAPDPDPAPVPELDPESDAGSSSADDVDDFTAPELPPDPMLDDWDADLDDYEDGVYADYCRDVTGQHNQLKNSADPVEQALGQALSDPVFGECTFIETQVPIDKPDDDDDDDFSQVYDDDDEPGFWSRLWDWLWGDDDDRFDDNDVAEEDGPGFWTRLWDWLWGEDETPGDADFDDPINDPGRVDGGNNNGNVRDAVGRAGETAGGSLSWLLYGAIALAVLIGLFFLVRGYRRRRRLTAGEKKRRPKQRFKVGEEIVDTRKMPKNAAQKAQALWNKGSHRDALSLLYRATLAELVTRYWVEFPDSATEGECLALAREQAPAEAADYLADLTLQWQLLAYAHRQPDDAEIQRLCNLWVAALRQSGGKSK